MATTVDTPVTAGAPAKRVDAEYVIVPVLRAGLGMSPAVQEVLPHTRVCLVGLRRNETTLQPDVYLDGLPDGLDGAHVVVCDPMLATGGSLDCVLTMLEARGAARGHGAVPDRRAPRRRPGVVAPPRRARSSRPRSTRSSTTSATSRPGLGDAGDRLFGPPVR